MLDGSRRGRVVGFADDQHFAQAEPPSFAEHLAERPGGQTPTARRGPDAVADMTSGVQQRLGEFVPQRDRAEYLVVLDDPPVGAVA